MVQLLPFNFESENQLKFKISRLKNKNKMSNLVLRWMLRYLQMKIFITFGMRIRVNSIKKRLLDIQ
jgi:hypothetical protein